MMKLPSETARVLITVKTYPNPSETHMETVCTAGVRLDGDSPSWIRLYPIRFRSLEERQRFRKYAIVDVDVQPRGNKDARIESYSPTTHEFREVGFINSGNNWQDRISVLDGLIAGTTTCQLRADATAYAMNVPSPSLGLIKPLVTKVTVSDGDAWSPDQLAKVRSAAAPTLFGDEVAELEPPPYSVHYAYQCESPNCSGHNQKVLDWELGEAGRRWRRQYGHATGKEKIREMLEDFMLDPKCDLHFFVGNQHLHRGSFSVLGCWYPPVGDGQFGLF